MDDYYFFEPCISILGEHLVSDDSNQNTKRVLLPSLASLTISDRACNPAFSMNEYDDPLLHERDSEELRELAPLIIEQCVSLGLWRESIGNPLHAIYFDWDVAETEVLELISTSKVAIPETVKKLFHATRWIPAYDYDCDVCKDKCCCICR
jgi:hypothetical protein